MHHPEELRPAPERSDPAAPIAFVDRAPQRPAAPRSAPQRPAAPRTPCTPADEPRLRAPVFAGIGGASAGARSAGLDVALGVDSHAQRLDVFKLNFAGAESVCGQLAVPNSVFTEAMLRRERALPRQPPTAPQKRPRRRHLEQPPLRSWPNPAVAVHQGERSLLIVRVMSQRAAN